MLMLDPAKRRASSQSVRLFMENCGSIYNIYQGVFYVLVVDSLNRRFQYKSVPISISYNYNYGDYQVSIEWEADSDAQDYKRLGLHGCYSTNFQFFDFSSNSLAFTDGALQISIT